MKNRFTKSFILEAIQLILENNTFSFNDQYYRQTKGTAMGTKFAPVYSTLIIGYLEELLYKQITLVFVNDLGDYFSQNWKRFLDDYFIPWTKSVMNLETLHNILNKLHKDIRFTLQYSNIEQAFLDVLLKKQNSKIETDIFYRDTDSKQYLLFYSYHPRHTKVNIPYNLERRLRTIISEDRILKTRMQELKSFLTKQNYPIQILDHRFERAMSLDKDQLRTVKARKYENIIPYVSTYNPKDSVMFRVIVDHLPILQEDVQMCDILSRYKIIKSKRQPYNLKRLLSKAKFVSNDKYEVRKCNRANCGLCIHLVESSIIPFKCGINFKVHESMSCM